MANGNPYYVSPVGHGAAPLFAGFQQGVGLRQQMKQMAMEQALKEEQVKQAQFGASNSLGATDASLGLPTAGQPLGMNTQGPSAPVPVPNAVALPWMEKRMEAQERSKDRGLQRDIAGQGKAIGYANQFRDEFNKASESFKTIVPAYKTIVTAATLPPEKQTAQSDMSLIFAYMKLLDPTSTVREGEYATAQNAGNVPESVRNQWNRVFGKGEKLQPEQRINFARSAQNKFRNDYETQKLNMQRYTDLATRARVSPEDVVFDFGKGIGNEVLELPGAVAPATPEGAWNPDAEIARIRQRRGANAPQ